MFRFLQKLERMAAAVGMAEGYDFDTATDILDGKYEKPMVYFALDGKKKQPPRPRPVLHI